MHAAWIWAELLGLAMPHRPGEIFISSLWQVDKGVRATTLHLVKLVLMTLWIAPLSIPSWTFDRQMGVEIDSCITLWKTLEGVLSVSNADLFIKLSVVSQVLCGDATSTRSASFEGLKTYLYHRNCIIYNLYDADSHSYSSGVKTIWCDVQ